MMKASELVRRHIDVAKNYKTVYMWGCFGAPVGETIIDEKSAQYPDWYTGGRVTYLRSLIGKVVYGFDCVNLTKGILWGWNGNKNAYYGGARYASNSVPDVSADGMIAKCTGEIGQADFVAAYFQIVGGTLSQCLTDLDLQLLLFSLCSLDQLGGLLVLLDKGQ